MVKLFIATILLFISQNGYAGELLTINRADYDFDTHLRVGMPAQIVEAPDASLVGQSAPFIQSLRYTASKQVILNLNFSSLMEITVYMRDQLCKEIHHITLLPIRDSGTKGTNSFVAKMNAKMITVTGVNVTAKGKVFTQTMSCK